MNGKTVEDAAEQVRTVREQADKHGRRVRFGINGFAVVRDTEAEAVAVVDEIIAKADVEKVTNFGEAVKQAGASTADRKGMWADSEFKDLVQYNDGFRTGLIGTPEQVAPRVLDYKAAGVDVLLCGFLHVREEVERFGEQVIPLVRQLEEQGYGVEHGYAVEQGSEAAPESGRRPWHDGCARGSERGGCG